MIKAMDSSMALVLFVLAAFVVIVVMELCHSPSIPAPVVSAPYSRVQEDY